MDFIDLGADLVSRYDGGYSGDELTELEIMADYDADFDIVLTDEDLADA